MVTEQANKDLDKLISDIEKNGIVPDKNIAAIQKIREYALKESDPLVTRALRLAWQHIEGNDGFELNYLAEEDENATPTDNLLYLLSLCKKSENTYNRDELREMTNMLQRLG
jgi:hypothetical protein